VEEKIEKKDNLRQEKFPKIPVKMSICADRYEDDR
jgi:hypothetical protein